MPQHVRTNVPYILNTTTVTSREVTWWKNYTAERYTSEPPSLYLSLSAVQREVESRRQEDWERERGEYERWQAALMTSREVAEEQAQEVLQNVLPAHIYASFKQVGYLIVPSKMHEGFFYRLFHTWDTVYTQIWYNGKEVGGACLQPREWLPATDRLLVQYLLLVGDESQFLAIANLWTVHSEPVFQWMKRRV